MRLKSPRGGRGASDSLARGPDGDLAENLSRDFLDPIRASRWDGIDFGLANPFKRLLEEAGWCCRCGCPEYFRGIRSAVEGGADVRSARDGEDVPLAKAVATECGTNLRNR